MVPSATTEANDSIELNSTGNFANMYSFMIKIAVVGCITWHTKLSSTSREINILYGFTKKNKIHLSGYLVYKFWIIFIETWHTVLLAYTSIVFCAVLHFHALYITCIDGGWDSQ